MAQEIDLSKLPDKATPEIDLSGLPDKAEETGLLDKISELPSKAFTTPEFISKGYEKIKESPILREILGFPMGGGKSPLLNPLLGLSEAMSTPGDAALAATTFGTGTIPRIISRGAGALLATRGGQRIWNAEGPMDYAAGALEILGGGLGMHTPKPRPVPKPTPKLLGPAPDFIVGPAGVARNVQHTIDIGPVNPSPGIAGSGTIRPREYGEVIDVAPDVVAREGLSVGGGRPLSEVPKNEYEEALDALIPDRYKVKDLPEDAPYLGRKSNEYQLPSATKNVAPNVIQSDTPLARFVSDEAGRISPVANAAEEAGPFSAFAAKRRSRAQNPEVPRDLIGRFIIYLYQAKEARNLQTGLYSAERARRLGALSGIKSTGRARFFEELGILKGEYPKVEFESIASNFTDNELDTLFDIIDTTPRMMFFEKLHAKTGLAKMFGDYGGQLPQDNEIKAVLQSFGRFGDDIGLGFMEAIRKRTPWEQKVRKSVIETSNFRRALMASWDLSAPLRQGLPLIHKRAYWRSFGDMFRSWGSEAAYRAVNESIRSKRTAELAYESGLQLTDLVALNKREEILMSEWAEKIPGVRRSNRAYTAFLNKLRADAFEDLVIKYEKMGLNPFEDLTLTKKLAEFINTSTGRGSLGRYEKIGEELNSILFAPRLIASRVQMLNPIYYYKMPPPVRKEAIKSLFATTAAWMSFASLGAMAGGDVTLDPRSADFGKIRIGRTRLDPGTGFLQYITAVARYLDNSTTTNGINRPLGVGYRAPTRLNIIGRLLESKLHPEVGLAVSLMRGQDYLGRPINLTEENLRRFIPIFIQDVWDVAMEDPELIPIVVPLSGFGMGTQVYER